MTSPAVVHPIFTECQEYTLDPYWRDIFSRCACNRFPRGVRYDGKKNTIYLKLPGGIGGKKEFFVLPREPTRVFEIMMEIFRSIGLRSQKDLQLQKDEMEKIRKARCIDLDCHWKDLKPRYLKERMILNYVLTIQREFNLSQKEAKRLLNTIHLGFQLKQLTSDDVKYEKGRILDINSLEIDGEKRAFTIVKPIKTSHKNDKPSSGGSFPHIFVIYLNESKKQRLRL